MKIPALILLAAALVAASPSLAAAGRPSAEVRGKLVVKGKELHYANAWLVRGPDTGDDTKPAAYLVLSSQDLATGIAACKEIRCVLFDVLKDGAIVQPLDDGAESFWLRVVAPGLPHREEQISGRRWASMVDQHDRLSGKLQFSYSNTGDEADLEIDATLAKEFPVRRRNP